jgi:hypothetical protein
VLPSFALVHAQHRTAAIASRSVELFIAFPVNKDRAFGDPKFILHFQIRDHVI